MLLRDSVFKRNVTIEVCLIRLISAHAYYTHENRFKSRVFQEPASVSGVSKANCLCQLEASGRGFSGNYRAWVSSYLSIDAVCNIQGLENNSCSVDTNLGPFVYKASGNYVLLAENFTDSRQPGSGRLYRPYQNPFGRARKPMVVRAAMIAVLSLIRLAAPRRAMSRLRYRFHNGKG